MSFKHGAILFDDAFSTMLEQNIFLLNYGESKVFDPLYTFYDTTIFNNKIRLPYNYNNNYPNPDTNGDCITQAILWNRNTPSKLCLAIFDYIEQENGHRVIQLSTSIPLIYEVTNITFLNESLCELDLKPSFASFCLYRFNIDGTEVGGYGEYVFKVNGNITQCKFIPTVCGNAVFDTHRNFNASERISKRQPDLSNFVYEEIGLKIFKNESESYKAGAIVSSSKNLSYIMRQPVSDGEPLHWDEIPDATGTTISDGQYATNYYYFTIPAFIGLLERCFNYDYFACIKSVSVFPIYSDTFPYAAGETGFTKIGGGGVTTTAILETELNLFALTNNNGETTFCKSFNAFRDSEFRFTDISGTQHNYPIIKWESFKNSLFGEITCRFLLGFNPLNCSYTYTPCDYNGQEFNYSESFSVDVALGGDYFSNNLMKYLKKASQDFISGQVSHANGLSQFDLVYLDGVSVSNGNNSLYNETLGNITGAVAGFVEPLRKFTQFYAPTDTYLATVVPENLVNGTYYAISSLLEILNAYDLTSAFKSNFRTGLLQAKDSLGTIFNIPATTNIPSYMIEGIAVFGQLSLYCPTRYSLLCFYDKASLYGLPCNIFFNGTMSEFLNLTGEWAAGFGYPMNQDEAKAPDYFPVNYVKMENPVVSSQTRFLYNLLGKDFYPYIENKFREGIFIVDIRPNTEFYENNPYYFAPNVLTNLSTPSARATFNYLLLDLIKSPTYSGSAYDGTPIPNNLNFL